MDQDINPYRPPAAAVETIEAAPPERPLAGKGRRFLTFLIDYLVHYLFAFAAGIVLALAGAGEALANMNRLQEFLFGVLIFGGYYLFFEGLWGRTPGKLVMGTRVVYLQGGQPAFRDLVKRTLARLVPFEPFTFFGETGFHDRASRTRVVLVR